MTADRVLHLWLHGEHIGEVERLRSGRARLRFDGEAITAGGPVAGLRRQRPSSWTTSAPVSATRAAPGSTSLEPRIPEPITTCSSPVSEESTSTR